MSFVQNIFGWFTVSVLAFSSCAASEFSSTNQYSDLLSIEVSRGSVSVLIRNNTPEAVGVLDTLMLSDAKLPPILSFKIVELNGKEITDLSRLDLEADWHFPPNYREYAFAVSKKRIQLEPGSFIAKSWSLADILGSYALCKNEECLFLVKFEARAYPKEDVKESVITETPWFVYSGSRRP